MFSLGIMLSLICSQMSGRERMPAWSYYSSLKFFLAEFANHR